MKTDRFISACFGLFCLLGTTLGRAEVATVFVQSTLDYNAILITEVDVVFIYDEDLLAQMPTSKSAWYGNKRSFMQEAGDRIDVVNLFAPQGFDSAMLSLPQRKAEAVKVFVFGQHDISTRPPIDISDYEDVLVEINQFGIAVSRRN
ncbi:MAG: hypothetical protein RL120_10325 [Gammaproteobacteria bacterium]